MESLRSTKKVVESHPVVKHPYLQFFREGRLTKQQVQEWAVQQFFFSVSLPRCFAALYARIPDKFWRQKRALVELLTVEAWGSSNPKCHSKHFVELCEFLEIDYTTLTEQEVWSCTRKYLNSRLDQCLNEKFPLSQGLATIAVGNELLNLYLFRAYREGINLIPGLERCPVGYFDAHLSDEGGDFEVFCQLYDLVVETRTDQRAAQSAVDHILNQRKLFFDDLYYELYRELRQLP